MPWATLSHTSGPPESPCGQRGQGLSSASSGLFSLPPWGGWSLLGALADIRVLLVLRFQSGPDNPPPPTGSLCPCGTLSQCPSPRDSRQDGTGGQAGDTGQSSFPWPQTQRPRLCMDSTGDLTLKELFFFLASPAHICVVVL